MAFTIEIKPVFQLSQLENAQTDEVGGQAFYNPDPTPVSEMEGIEWSNAEFFVLGALDGRIVSQIGLLRREVRVGEQVIPVGGVGGVATHPEFQRRGYAGLLLDAAARFMRDEMDVSFGMLVCSPQREPYYRKFNWQPVRDRVVFDTPTGQRAWHEVTMILPLTGETWPRGLVDMCGHPW